MRATCSQRWLFTLAFPSLGRNIHGRPYTHKRKMRFSSYNRVDLGWQGTPESSEVTGLLKAWRGGDQHALERLMPLVYGHLRAQARRYIRYEREGLTLQGTALVHEAFLRLVEGRAVDWRDRSHFLA